MRLLFSLFIYAFPMMVFALGEFDLDVIQKYMENLDKVPESQNNIIDPKLMKLDEDPLYFKGQPRNNLVWEEVQEHEWLSIKQWKDDRAIKDKDLEWRSKLRLSLYDEVVGKVIKCVGVCYSYRGIKKVRSEYQSLMVEGDEFVTTKDSFAWIFLMDGSLVRIAPESSISLLEINFTKEENFLMLRLNHGYMNYLPRSSKEVPIVEKVETDLGVTPLGVKEANREFYMMKGFRELSGEAQYNFTIQKSPGAQEQYTALNELISKNNEFIGSRKTKVFLFTPNFSIEGSNGIAHMFYQPNGKGFFYLSPLLQEDGEDVGNNTDIVVGKRGYNKTDSFTPNWNSWYEVDSNGVGINLKEEENKLLKGSLGFIKRIPSIQLVRELWIDQKLKPIFTSDMSEKIVAKKFGYRLWNIKDPAEQQKRVNFIREFTRRVETTNLKVMEKVFASKKPDGFTLKYIRKPLVTHYMKVKKRYTEERSKVYRFTDTEYYLWLIRNGI